MKDKKSITKAFLDLYQNASKQERTVQHGKV